MSSAFESVWRSLELIGRKFRALAGDQRALSAVEFALILPLMVTLYLGSVEVSQGIGAKRKVTMTARTIADLVSQPTNVTNADMTNSLNAAAAVIAPFSANNLIVTVSSVKIDANGTATIDWSDTLHGTAHSKGSPVSLPTALAVPNTYLLWSEVQYSYTPAIGYVITGTLLLKEQAYMAPRQSASVTRSAT